MQEYVQANFDFSAQPGSGELTIKVGDQLMVIRKNIEGGWMEGQNAKGKIGLFPESYVSPIPAPVHSAAASSSLPPPMAPPPLPVNVQIPPANYSVPPVAIPLAALPKSSHDPWDDPRIPIAPPYVPPGSSAPASLPATNTYNLDDDFDDDWSDEDEEVAEYSASHGAQRDVARSRSTGPDTASMAGKQMGTSKMKTINRFSNFVKTGMESYILAATKINSERTEKHAILLKDNNHIEWLHPKEIYTCVVSKPKKESKLKGLKSFIAYSLTSSLSGIQVSRRYKHFDWLHEQLASKYLLIPIPPLPEKQVSGRYEEDLIEHRKSILQVWVNKICRHPVLSQSNVWKHFMTCTDANNWKKGKRAAEKDEYVGGNFFHCIEVPEQPVDSRQIEKQIDGYAKCVRSMDESTRELFERITDNQKRLIGPYKSNWQKMAAAFDSLGKSLDLDSSQPNSPVKNAIRTSAHTLHKIGNQHEEHGKKDMEQLLDYLYIYKGLFTNIPDIVNVHRSALSKIRDNDRLQAEGKLAPQDADAIHHRVDVTTYSMMAEISHFNQERDADFRHMFGDFFAQQAAFYSSIGEQMAQLAALYKN
uniref:Sorting nexin n=1 Tax=Ditylenchus dipsaci TaxID=166011 RepID=A0A915DC50_9BILA